MQAPAVVTLENSQRHVGGRFRAIGGAFGWEQGKHEGGPYGNRSRHRAGQKSAYGCARWNGCAKTGGGVGDRGVVVWK